MKKYIYILFACFLLAGCRLWPWKEEDPNRVQIKIQRYDRLQFESAMLNSVSAQQRMNIDFPQATKLLIEDVLSIGQVNDPRIFQTLNTYFADSTLQKLMLDSEERFSDMRPLEKQLNKGFDFLAKEIPGFQIPRIYAQISALNQSIVVSEGLLGISIDKYMGVDYPLYQQYYYPYQIKSMSPDRIPIDCIKFYLISLYPFKWEDSHRTLFDMIMYRGKIGWVVQKALGYGNDDRNLYGYSHDEWNWAKHNQYAVWKELTQRNLLGSTDPMIIRIFTQPTPSAILKKYNLPPNFGVWLGVQLIERYMKQYPQTTITELLQKDSFTDWIEKVKW